MSLNQSEQQNTTQKVGEIDIRIQASKKPVNQQPINNFGAQGAFFGLILFVALAFLILNLAFIIANLYYQYEGPQCVLATADGISFNLSTRLKVDAYTKIPIVGLLFLIAFTPCCSASLAATCTLALACILIMYGLFSFAWTIVGSVLFWNKINPTGVCSGGFRHTCLHNQSSPMFSLRVAACTMSIPEDD